MVKYQILAGSSSIDLAKKISKHLNAEIITVEKKIFPDGESKLTIKGNMKNGKIIVVQSIYPPVDSNLIQALSLVSKAKEHSNDICGVIPYMGYAKQDKQFLSGEIITIAVIARLFESVGIKKLIVVDIHSDEGLNFFKIKSKNISAIPLLSDYFKKIKLNSPLVVSPDLFWSNKAKEFAENINANSIALGKQRNRKTGKLVIKSKKPTNIPHGCDLIFLDDMVSTGGSIIKAIEFLGKKKFGRIFVACTHAVLAGNAEKNLKNAGVDKIISTNTIPGKHAIVDISGIIAEQVKRFNT